jgi:hypothetical protein
MDALPAELIVAIAAHLGEPDRAALRAAAPWLAACLPAAWCFDLERHALRQSCVDPDMLRAIDPAHVRQPLQLALASVCLGHTALAVQLIECHGAAFADADAIRKAFCQAAVDGHLAVCRWLFETFHLTAEDARTDNNHAFKCAASSGHLDVCQWLTETFDMTAVDARADDNIAFSMAAAHGNLAVCRWLVETFHLTAEDACALNNRAYQWASYWGHWAMGRWLAETFGLTAEDLMRAERRGTQTFGVTINRLLLSPRLIDSRAAQAPGRVATHPPWTRCPRSSSWPLRRT